MDSAYFLRHFLLLMNESATGKFNVLSIFRTFLAFCKRKFCRHITYEVFATYESHAVSKNESATDITLSVAMFVRNDFSATRHFVGRVVTVHVSYRPLSYAISLTCYLSTYRKNKSAT